MQVIDETGKPLGILPTHEALALAREKELDLVEVSPIAKPPVAKIMDYGQWQYKQARTQVNKAKKIEVKVIQLSLKIGQHDIDVRIKRAEQFFAKGDKVKVVLRLRGREKTRKDLAADIIRNFSTALGPDIIIEKPLSFQGAELSITIAKK